MTPQIIRTRSELAALDPDTLLTNRRDAWGDSYLPVYEWLDYDGFITDMFPLAVVATGDHVRAARAALTDEATP